MAGARAATRGQCGRGAGASRARAGRAAYGRCEAYYCGQRHDKITLQVATDNPAQILYFKRGYRITRYLKNQPSAGGKVRCRCRSHYAHVIRVRKASLRISVDTPMRLPRFRFPRISWAWLFPGTYRGKLLCVYAQVPQAGAGRYGITDAEFKRVKRREKSAGWPCWAIFTHIQITGLCFRQPTTVIT